MRYSAEDRKYLYNTNKFLAEEAESLMFKLRIKKLELELAKYEPKIELQDTSDYSGCLNGD